MNGLISYRLACITPEANFTLLYGGNPILSDQVPCCVNFRCELRDVDIIFWGPPDANGFNSKLAEYQACGQDVGTVPVFASFAEVYLIGSWTGPAYFSYREW